LKAGSGGKCKKHALVERREELSTMTASQGSQEGDSVDESDILDGLSETE